MHLSEIRVYCQRRLRRRPGGPRWGRVFLLAKALA